MICICIHTLQSINFSFWNDLEKLAELGKKSAPSSSDKLVPTAIQVDNSTAVGIAKKEFLQEKSKAIYMRFCWINNRIKQGQFRVFWRPGSENLGNYHSKNHPPEHHIAVCSKYILVPNLLSLQGCVNLTVRVNPTKRESQWAQLQHYFLGCVS